MTLHQQLASLEQELRTNHMVRPKGVEEDLLVLDGTQECWELVHKIGVVEDLTQLVAPPAWDFWWACNL